MDYRELLIKYMAHVLSCEGTDYTDSLNDGMCSPVRFSRLEIAELEQVSIRADKLSGRSYLND